MALLAACAASGGAAAQDSVSRNSDAGNGLPGDAVGAFGVQRYNYVVDLAPLQTSWRTSFGVAPVLKSLRVASGRFSATSGPVVVSPDVLASATPLASSYSRWTAAGGGINATDNNTALNTLVTPPAQLSTLGVAMLDFDENVASDGSLGFANVISGALVGVDPASPSRLYVTRVHAAVNALNLTSLDVSQFGLGSVDASGNLTFRADSFGSGGAATSLLQGDNYFRVRLPQRSAGINFISNAGASNSPATDRVAIGSSDLLSAPHAVPASLAGRSVLLGANLKGQMLGETAANTLAPFSTHLGSAPDQRGSVAITPRSLFGGASVASGAMAANTTLGGVTNAIATFAIASNGTPTSWRVDALPSAISDPCDGFSWPIAGGDFRQYDNQSIFRGGVGPVAIGSDSAGRALIAGTVYNASRPGTSTSANALVVGRLGASQATPATWSLAAWVDINGGDGKDVLGDYGLDGVPNTSDGGEGDGVVNGSDAPIGRLAAMGELAGGLAGPSISAPAFDAAGNVYFIAAMALNRLAGSVVMQDFTVGLVRGVYDPGLLCYRLELVLRQGSVFAGQNSARNYQVSWLGLADPDSLSSSSLFSSSASGAAWNNADTSSLPATAPQHLGGLAVSARIVYDVNNDGVFEDLARPGVSQASVDEAYNVALLVANTLPTTPACDSIDFNRDTLFPDSTDLDDFIAVLSGGPSACSTFPSPGCNDVDFNNDGFTPDSLDLDAFLSRLGGGPCLQ